MQQNPSTTTIGTPADPDVKTSGLIVLGALGVLVTLRLIFRKIAD